MDDAATPGDLGVTVIDWADNVNDPIDKANAVAAARDYLDQVGLVPTPDAIAQLTDAFLPALSIMCKRGYDPNGATWREGGWRSILLEIRKKAARLWFRGWLKGNYDADSSLDLMNYAAMYYRLKNEGPPWGFWGEPGEPDTPGVVATTLDGHHTTLPAKQ